MEWESSFKGRDKRSSFPRSKPVTDSCQLLLTKRLLRFAMNAMNIFGFSMNKWSKQIKILKTEAKIMNTLKQYNANKHKVSVSQSLLRSGSRKYLGILKLLVTFNYVYTLHSL